MLNNLREKADRKQIGDVEELKRLLKEELLRDSDRGEKPVNSVDGEPEVILVVGVNGTGKTTTIGKLAHALRSQGKNVLLCAADTFRAAAIEQLEVWGAAHRDRSDQDQTGRRSPAVLFDALQAAKRPQGRLRHCGHRRPPAHQGQPDGRAGQDAANRAAHHRRRPARDSAGDGRHHRTERTCSRPSCSPNRPASPASC